MNAVCPNLVLIAFVVGCNTSLDSTPLRRDAAQSPEAALSDARPADASAQKDAMSSLDAHRDASDQADAPASLRCVKLVHIGDSLSAQTRDALKDTYGSAAWPVTIDAYGGRAILQKLSDDPKTGKQAALDANTAGFSGCWVVALGTNDTANVAAGAWYTRDEAIDEMLTAIDPARVAPVLWVNAYTLRTDGYWSNSNMRAWNDALDAASTRWSNMQVLDWAAYAQAEQVPFSDGIHHTTAGYNQRNQWIVEQVSAQWR